MKNLVSRATPCTFTQQNLSKTQRQCVVTMWWSRVILANQVHMHSDEGGRAKARGTGAKTRKQHEIGRGAGGRPSSPVCSGVFHQHHPPKRASAEGAAWLKVIERRLHLRQSREHAHKRDGVPPRDVESSVKRVPKKKDGRRKNKTNERKMAETRQGGAALETYLSGLSEPGGEVGPRSFEVLLDCTDGVFQTRMWREQWTGQEDVCW
jgi:hypothetical protein